MNHHREDAIWETLIHQTVEDLTRGLNTFARCKAKSKRKRVLNKQGRDRLNSSMGFIFDDDYGCSRGLLARDIIHMFAGDPEEFRMHVKNHLREKLTPEAHAIFERVLRKLEGEIRCAR